MNLDCLFFMNFFKASEYVCLSSLVMVSEEFYLVGIAIFLGGVLVIFDDNSSVE